MQNQVGDESTHQILALPAIQQRHINDADVHILLLGQDASLILHLLIIAPQSVDALNVEQVARLQFFHQLFVLGTVEILAGHLVHGDYTMNHVQGCAHGCKFPCYAFLMKKRFGQIKDYEEWLEPCLVSNTLELLDREIPRLRNKIQSVQLCFTTDPFMNGYPEVSTMSIAAIRKLNNAGIRCTTLTKGILPLELAQLSPENEHGITLISLDESYREKMEPGASPFLSHICRS